MTANGLLQRGGDNTYSFHQDSSFWYLTGITEPDVMLVIEQDREYLIIPQRSSSREAFDGALNQAVLSAQSGISLVLGWEDGKRELQAAVERQGTAAITTSPPPYIEQYGMYTNPARAQLEQVLRDMKPDIELSDIRADITSLRMIKQTPELLALKEAIAITSHSLELLTASVRFAGYRNEYELEADLTREFRYRGAGGHAFAPIIAGGQRACTLHNVSNEAALEANTLVVLDVGAEVHHYAADITRTRAYGKPSARQQQVFDAVLDVQAYALGLLKPGILPKEYEQQVETYMGQKLQELKLVKKADHDSIRTYFPHATSHFLGLDVHDAGDYSRPLEAGVVLTCEPGIYIPEEGIGVRLEDDVLITVDGNEVLSGNLPKTLV